MTQVVTLTLNPAIDGACETQTVAPTHKIRTKNDRYNPGGGGINVARVVKRLGGRATAVYMAGGATGSVIEHLLDDHGIDARRIAIAGHTRISMNIFEQSSGLEYRFVPEGPEISEAEAVECRTVMAAINSDFLVVSGALPRGAPVCLYADIVVAAASRGSKILLDTSGPALGVTLRAGHIFLVKPSRGELETLVGRKLPDLGDIITAAEEIVASGHANNVVVTMGSDGAVLVHGKGHFFLPALPVDARSTVGAGDSFVGGAVYALSAGATIENAFRLGVAAATATVLSPGTDLCHKPDVDALLRQLAGT